MATRGQPGGNLGGTWGQTARFHSFAWREVECSLTGAGGPLARAAALLRCQRPARLALHVFDEIFRTERAPGVRVLPDLMRLRLGGIIEKAAPRSRCPLGLSHG